MHIDFVGYVSTARLTLSTGGKIMRHHSSKLTMSSIGLFLALILVPIIAFGQTLTVWVGDGETRLREYEVVARLFEEQNPGVTVEVISQAGSQAEVMEKITLAIVSGAAPDAMWMEGSGVIEFAAQGLLMDLTETLDGMRFTPADTQEMTFDGKMWGVPYHTASRGLFKRVDHFDQVGMDAYAEAASLEDLRAWNQKLIRMDADQVYTQVGFIPWVGNWGAPAWIWAFGGELLEANGSDIRPTATLPQNVAAFEWIRGWAEMYGNVAPVAGGSTGFQNGTVSMSGESTSVVGRYLDAEVPFTVGRMPHAPDGKNGTWGGGTAVSVPINAPNPEWALKLARFFGETDTQIQRFAATPNVLPANWDALITVGRELPIEYGPLLDQLPEARARTPLWIEYYVQQLIPALNAVVAGTKTPQQALVDVQRVMEVRYADIFGD